MVQYERRLDEYANLAESIYTNAWLRLGDVPIWYFRDQHGCT